jgi:hypothetical protein
MTPTRRDLLRLAAATVAAHAAPGRSVSGAGEPSRTELETRVERIITEYSEQGDHRTATRIDQASGDWLCRQVTEAGLAPARETFAVSRIDLQTSVVIVGARRINGVPLFDGGFTDAGGISGSLGALQGERAIGLAECAPNTAASGILGETRRSGRHAAIVCLTRGGRAGLCPSNADSFLTPFGPPVVQVSSEHAAWLSDQAERGAEARVIADVRRVPATAFNVTATIEGRDPTSRPVVISTPRSGWYSCASERGGGIACWLEVMRALREARLVRPLIFVAFSGHEIGSLGIHAFVDKRQTIIRSAAAWIHLGANIGASTPRSNRLAASDDDFDRMVTDALSSAGVTVDQRNPRGSLPGGEAEMVHRGGARYVALTGGNALFHNPDDRGPQVVNRTVIVEVSDAFVAIAKSLAAA